MEGRRRMGAADRQEEPSSDLVMLHRQAMEDFKLRCFWNCCPSPTPAGMRVVADQLEKYGDMRAWQLATRIRETLEHAARCP